jgi:hypothetical protein
MNNEQKLEYVYNKVENMSSKDFADFILSYFGEEYLFNELKDSVDSDAEENVDIAIEIIDSLEEKEQKNEITTN